MTGIKINLDSSARSLVPCRYCGSLDGVTGPGTSTHAARIECAQPECGRFLNWLSFDLAYKFNLIERI